VFAALAVSQEAQTLTGMPIRNGMANSAPWAQPPSPSTAPPRPSHGQPHRPADHPRRHRRGQSHALSKSANSGRTDCPPLPTLDSDSPIPPSQTLDAGRSTGHFRQSNSTSTQLSLPRR
jgi:hypothetical protein